MLKFNAANPIRSTVLAMRGYFLKVGVFSAIVNIMTLSGSLYMLQVYDRVLGSRSVATLVALTFLLVVVYAFQGLFDTLRLHILGRMGAHFAVETHPVVYRIMRQAALHGGAPDQVYQPVRDVDAVRHFMSGMGPTALFDLPFMPLFFFFCFLLHPWVGIFALVGGLIIIAIAVTTEMRSRAYSKAVGTDATRRQNFMEQFRRNIEVVSAMGMHRVFGANFGQLHGRYVGSNLSASAEIGAIGVVAKVFRQALQSLTLGLGAYLVIRGEMSGGSMIACSILAARALAPIEIAVANWRNFVAARQGYERLEKRSLETMGATGRTTHALPSYDMLANGLWIPAPGRDQPIIRNLSFRLEAGQGLGIVGPSGSGKTTLLRGIIGLWPVKAGEVRFDGVALDQWNPDDLGQAIGYMPQDVELFEGTVAENIARFSPDRTSEQVIAAAQAAGAHQLILSLPDGYDTVLGENGSRLSGGERQRIGLARALYGDPFLVILDEPNAGLDKAGEIALTNAIRKVRSRGGIVIVVTHRLSAVAGVNLIGVLVNGSWQMIGPRDEVLAAIAQDQAEQLPPARAET